MAAEVGPIDRPLRGMESPSLSFLHLFALHFDTTAPSITFPVLLISVRNLSVSAIHTRMTSA